MKTCGAFFCPFVKKTYRVCLLKKEMLKPAYLHITNLNDAYSKIIYSEYYKYLVEDIWDFELDIKNNDEKNIQFVSVDITGKIIGYFDAKINRLLNKVENIEVINFSQRPNPVFSIDFHRFIVCLTTDFCFRKINFEVICGSPFESIYDKHISKYNGRIVGIKKGEARLRNGLLCDVKIYEIFSNNYCIT